MTAYVSAAPLLIDDTQQVSGAAEVGRHMETPKTGRRGYILNA